ncbi:MAG: PAS domain S-box protein [Thermodesulfobacteriota bacterium]|nr:PAS domain S-box protein [Thermodesulfobacteriota bacterium]
MKALKTTLGLCVLIWSLIPWAPAYSAPAQSSEKTLPSFPDSTKPCVLVLHSYHYGFTWSDSISRGIQSVFAEQAGRVELCFEFMDTRHIYTEEYFEKLKTLYSLKFAERPVDVIIASDDHAFSFMLGSGQAVFPNVPVVFCSVSGYEPSMRQGREITGLVESIDIKSTLDIALRLHPRTRQVTVITDMTRTGRALKAKAESIFEGYKSRLGFRYLEDLTIDDLKHAVSGLSDDTIVFLFIFSRDKAGRVFSHEHNLRILVEQCNVPIYSVWKFYLGHGIVGGMLASGEAEGKMAGEMALRILGGENASDIPLEKSPTQYMFDDTRLEQFGVKESLLPTDCLIVNKAVSFYEGHRGIVWTAASIIVLLGVAVAILSGNILLRMRAEKELRQSEQRFRAVFENAVDGIIIADRERKRFLVGNEKMCEMLGCAWEEIPERGVADICPRQDLARVVNAFEKLASGEIILAENIPVERKDGSVFFADVSGGPVTLGDQHCMIVIFRDITERKRSEALVRESEEKYRLLVDNADDAIFIAQDGMIRFPNPKTEEVAGYSSEELESVPFMNLIHPEDRDMVLERHRKRLEGEEVPSVYSFRIINRKGQELWVEINAIFITWEGRPATLNFVRDITPQKRLEDQLRQAQKMEAIGTLAGGIAHDFNNVLAAIIGYTEMSLDDAPEGSMLQASLREVLKAGGRARDLVQQILTFSRQSEQELRPLQLRPVLKEALKLLRASLPTTIEIRQDIQSESAVMGDPTQMHQVLMNLCTNAGHAMQRGGGVLTVSLSDVELDANFAAEHHDVSPGPYLRLSVSDTGHGMNASTMERIFEPYFTTKEKEAGTGLGLAVVHGIVQSQGGTITVESEPGQGTTFQVYLPVIPRADDQGIESPADLPTGREHILFIEDEEALSKLGKQLLERLGYSVVASTSGSEALEAFSAGPDRFDLVITDMTMPGMTGEKLALEMMKIRPDIPVILCTGFSPAMTEKKAKALGIRAFLMKPLHKEDIARTVRQVLDE